MDAISGLPFFPLEITKEGTLFSAQQRSAIENAASQAGAGKVTDFFVIATAGITTWPMRGIFTMDCLRASRR